MIMVRYRERRDCNKYVSSYCKMTSIYFLILIFVVINWTVSASKLKTQ